MNGHTSICEYITVAGYQIGKPIKLVAFSTNYIIYFSMQRDKIELEHTRKRVCTAQQICLGKN